MCLLQENEHEEVVEEPLSVENTLWANTVLASGAAPCCVCVCVYLLCMFNVDVYTGSVSGLVIYTGSDTRSVMNASSPRSKVIFTVLLYIVHNTHTGL